MFPKIPSTEAIRAWDKFTINSKNISSYELMEQASLAFCNWFKRHYSKNESITVFCGKGSNGGDGLAIARLLLQNGFTVNTYHISEIGLSKDNQRNLDELKKLTNRCVLIPQNLEALQFNTIIIDALLGSGLTRPIEGKFESLIKHINQKEKEVIAVDVPSGLLGDSPQKCIAVKANTTVSFQRPKLAYFIPKNHKYVGNWQVVNIGLTKEFEQQLKSTEFYLTKKGVSKLVQPRKKFSHKGTFGHTLVVGGSEGKFGALVLASKAALRSGTGLVSVTSSQAIGHWFHAVFPEAMITNMKDLSQNISSITIGPGLGLSNESLETLKQAIEYSRLNSTPLVVDADGLNLLAQHKDLFKKLPPKTIFTPHPKEFERLFGQSENWKAQHDFIKKWCKTNQHIIVLKGAHTIIGLPDGNLYFNTSGCNGLATAGSGDVLAGIVGGLLAQGYSNENASILGVYLHGLAGEQAALETGNESLIASDIIEYLGSAYRHLST